MGMTANASNDGLLFNKEEEQRAWKEPGIESRNPLIHTICRLHFQKSMLFFRN